MLSALKIDHVVYIGNTATLLPFTEVVYLFGKKKGEFYLAQKIKRLPSCSSTSCERNLYFMVIDDFQAQFKCLNQIAVGLAVNHLFHVLEMISKTSLNPFFMKASTRAHTV